MYKNKVATLGLIALFLLSELFIAYLWRDSNKDQVDLTNSHISCYHRKRDWYQLRFTVEGSLKYLEKTYSERECKSQIDDLSSKRLLASYLINSDIIYQLEVDGVIFHQQGKPREAFSLMAFMIWSIAFMPIYRKLKSRTHNN